MNQLRAVDSNGCGQRGYADAIIETRKFVWVFELKFNKSTKAAVRQIREKG